MRHAMIAAIAALALATPAPATGGFECRATDRSCLAVAGVLGHGIVSQLVSARLIEGGRTFSSTGNRPALSIAQSWIDSRGIRFDLADPNATRFEARLRARIMLRNQGTGTLVRKGRSHPVRCMLDG